MKDKIKEVFYKIHNLIENESLEKEYHQAIYRNADVPVRKVKHLFTIFPSLGPSEFDIEFLERRIKESKEIASNHNQSKLVIGDYQHDKSIILYYYETEQEVLDRLNDSYDYLLKYIKRQNDKEYETYLKLKTKYEK